MTVKETACKRAAAKESKRAQEFVWLIRQIVEKKRWADGEMVEQYRKARELLR